VIISGHCTVLALLNRDSDHLSVISRFLLLVLVNKASHNW